MAYFLHQVYIIPKRNSYTCQEIFQYISEDKDAYAGYVVLKCKLQGQSYTLVSIYNHQIDTKTLDKLSRYLQLMATGLLVIGGDFNTVLNPFIDKKCYTDRTTNNRTQSKLLPCVENLMKSSAGRRLEKKKPCKAELHVLQRRNLIKTGLLLHSRRVLVACQKL